MGPHRFPGARRDAPAGLGRPTRRAFWILSDLRLDKDPGYVLPDPPDCDAVMVAGNVAADLCDALDGLSRALAGRQGARPVFVVPGNVEYRSPTPRRAALARARELAARLGLHLLSDDAVRFGPPHGDGTVVIGATFWTDWQLRASGRASYARIAARTARDATGGGGEPIASLDPLDTLALHTRSRAYIEDTLTSVAIRTLGLRSGPNARIDCVRTGDVPVVLTCHAPTPRSLPLDWEGWHAEDCVAASLASEAASAMEAWGAPRLWIHGNVPRGVDHRFGRTRVVANPRVGAPGYAAFDPTLVVAA